jgi:hypothetical protein
MSPVLLGDIGLVLTPVALGFLLAIIVLRYERARRRDQLANVARFRDEQRIVGGSGWRHGS